MGFSTTRRGNKHKYSKFKSNRTRKARVALSKVNYVPTESKMLDTAFSAFTANNTNSDPDITTGYFDLVKDIAQGTSDANRIGNTIYVKRIMWCYNWALNTGFTPVAFPVRNPIHVFLIAVKCEKLDTWWANTANSGSDIRPTTINSDYRALKSSCAFIIKHWRIDPRRRSTVATSYDNMEGKITHTFKTPFKVTYEDTLAKQLVAKNHLAIVTYQCNDTAAAQRNWNIPADTGAPYHNYMRIQFLG